MTNSPNWFRTGGGALIRFLTGEELPVVRALRNGARKFPAQATV